MNQKAWSPDERAEYEKLLSEVVNEKTTSRDRIDAMERKVLDAIQARRRWAREVERHATLLGYGSLIRSYLDRIRIPYVRNGNRVVKPRIIGVRRKSTDGTVADQQVLIDIATFDELREKRAAYLRQIKSYSDSVALADRLLALADLVPNAANPREAAKLLGTTVEAWLGENAA
jgi:DNA mismatch repair ATPase MutS